MLQETGRSTTTTTLPSPNGCGSPQWFQDGFCDTENNNTGCNWDGGDCCNNPNPEWKRYCKIPKICKCLDPNPGAYSHEIPT